MFVHLGKVRLFDTFQRLWYHAAYPLVGEPSADNPDEYGKIIEENFTISYESGATSVFILYMEAYYKKLITAIGENVNRLGLKETPLRAAKAFTYLTGGYKQDVRKVINNALFPSDNDEMIIVKDIELYSLCEHHLLPFFGKCHVGYLPDGKIIGLSKVARVVDIFSRRLQVQENLTRQIAETLMEQIGAKGIGVVIEARHLCMMMRGVEKQNSIMKTSCMLGAFRKESSTRAEFLSLIH